MKRLTAILLLLATGAATAAPKAEFTSREYDFGTVKARGGKVSHAFEAINTGDAPMVVTDIETSCECTRAKYSRAPVAPGDTLRIMITYDPKGQNGTFYKAIQVFSNTPDYRQIVVVRGAVEK